MNDLTMPAEGIAKAAVTVYVPVSPLRQPSKLLGAMVRDLARSRELAWRLFVRNLSAKYRQTMLGYLWAFLPPILTTGVFVYLQRAGYFTVGAIAVPYVAFVFAGLILWQVFTEALQTPLRMVQQSSAMLTKVNFPREALILAGMGEVLFGFLIRAVLLAGIFVWFGLPITIGIAGALAGVVALAALGLAAGLLLAPVALLYHDVGQALPFVLNLWMFLTPVLYPAPATRMGELSMIVNPVSPVLDTARAWLFGAPAQYLPGFTVVCVLAAVGLITGWLVYRLALPILIERISA